MTNDRSNLKSITVTTRLTPELLAMRADIPFLSWTHSQKQSLNKLFRQCEKAFLDGSDYVSITYGGNEIDRIYRDGRMWPPRAW